jgi:competence protein ComEC
MNRAMRYGLSIKTLADFFCRYHCLWIAGAFAFGILFNEACRPHLFVAIGGSAVSGLCCGIFHKKDNVFFVLMLVVFFFLGMLHCRAVCFLPDDHIYQVFNRDRLKMVSLKGIVIDDVKINKDKRPHMTFYFDVKEISYLKDHFHSVSGKIMVRSFIKADVQSGDRLTVSGKMHLPHDFKMGQAGSYKEYLKQNGIYLMITVGREGEIEKIGNARAESFFLYLRERIKNVFDEYLPEFESGFLKAILIGDRTGISNETRNLFVVTGTAHVLAISGLHMGIILGVFLVCTGILSAGLRTKYFLAVFLMVIYMPLAGGRASVMRSGIMAGLFLFSLISERRFCSLNILGLAAFLILLFRPLDIYAVGFQLSFSATAALIVFSDQFCRFLKIYIFVYGDWLHQAFSISLAAWLGVAGLVLYHFGTVTPVGLLANFFVVFLMAVLLTLGLMLVAFGFLQADLLAEIVAADIQVMMNILMRSVGLMSEIPFGHFENIFFGSTAGLIYYAVLIFSGVWLLWQKARKPSDMRGLS